MKSALFFWQKNRSMQALYLSIAQKKWGSGSFWSLCDTDGKRWLGIGHIKQTLLPFVWVKRQITIGTRVRRVGRFRVKNLVPLSLVNQIKYLVICPFSFNWSWTDLDSESRPKLTSLIVIERQDNSPDELFEQEKNLYHLFLFFVSFFSVLFVFSFCVCVWYE